MAEDTDTADDVHPGCLAGHDDLGHLTGFAELTSWVIGSAHHDAEASGKTVRRKPIVLVDHPVVAFPHRLGGERTRIGTGGVGLSHRKTPLELSIDQRKRPG